MAAEEMMLYILFLFFQASIFTSGQSAQTYNNLYSDRYHSDLLVKSTNPDVYKVFLRGMASQMPISPMSDFTGLPQKLVVALEEADKNGKLLRRSMCLLNIDEPGKVEGKEVSIEQQRRANCLEFHLIHLVFSLKCRLPTIDMNMSV